MPYFQHADNITMSLVRWCILLLVAANASAGTLDIIGVSLVRSFDPGLTGPGVAVGQVEVDAPGWEVNPAAVGQPASLFTWRSADGTAITFPNGLGTDSWHANEVGKLYFGITEGVAPGVQRLENYEAVYFTSDVVPLQVATAVHPSTQWCFTV